MKNSSKISLLGSALFVLVSFIGTDYSVKASDDVDNLNMHKAAPSIHKELYEKYKPLNPNWDFFYAVQEGKGELNGKTYTGDLAGKLPGVARKTLCSLGRIVGLSTTTSEANIPQLNEATEWEGNEIVYHFTYAMKNTHLYKGIYEFDIKAVLSPEDSILLLPIQENKTEEEEFSHMLMTAEEAQETLKGMKEELARSESQIRTNIHAIVMDVAQKLAYEQALKAGIEKIEEALTKQIGGRYVFIANRAANLIGYNNVLEAILEKKGILSQRQDNESKWTRISNTTWTIIGSFLPAYGTSLRYLTKAAANVTTGSNSLTEAAAGVHNGKTNRENVSSAASNVVKAGVCLAPGGKVVIALSAIAARYLGDQDSLTELALNNILFNKETTVNPSIEESLINSAARELLDDPEALQKASHIATTLGL